MDLRHTLIIPKKCRERIFPKQPSIPPLASYYEIGASYVVVTVNVPVDAEAYGKTDKKRRKYLSSEIPLAMPCGDPIESPHEWNIYTPVLESWLLWETHLASLEYDQWCAVLEFADDTLARELYKSAQATRKKMIAATINKRVWNPLAEELNEYVGSTVYPDTTRPLLPAMARSLRKEVARAY